MKSNNVEITYEQVKAMGLYFFETLGKLANGLSQEEIAKREAKNKPTTLMQAIAEVICPDNEFAGTYQCYSQRTFDQGNAGDPYEYTGLQIKFTLPSGISITIDTKYCQIQAQHYKNRFQIGMGQKLIQKLDDLGMALWQDWDDAPDSMIEKLRNVEDDQAWMDGYFDETWSDPANSSRPVALKSQFVRDVEAGFYPRGKITYREDCSSKRDNYFNNRYDVQQFYKAEREKFQASLEEDARRAKFRDYKSFAPKPKKASSM